jgi:hypothetical protein
MMLSHLPLLTAALSWHSHRLLPADVVRCFSSPQPWLSQVLSSTATAESALKTFIRGLDMRLQQRAISTPSVLVLHIGGGISVDAISGTRNIPRRSSCSAMNDAVLLDHSGHGEIIRFGTSLQKDRCDARKGLAKARGCSAPIGGGFLGAMDPASWPGASRQHHSISSPSRVSLAGRLSCLCCLCLMCQ